MPGGDTAGELLAQEPILRPAMEILEAHGLERSIEKYLSGAEAGSIRRFLEDVKRLDRGFLSAHQSARRAEKSSPLGAADVEPVKLLTLEQQCERNEADRKAGLHSLEAGRWASIAFAGGAGTRFFSHLDELQSALAHPNEVLIDGRFDSDEPKGAFPISPVGGTSFYGLVVAEALRCGALVGRMPWVVFLTSRVTHARTCDYLERRPFGLPAQAWMAMQQAHEPRLDEDGLLVVGRDGQLAWTGDGHGGVYRALLAHSGRIRDQLAQSGVTQLVMHNVDNAASRPFAPARLGFHIRENAFFTVSATRKVDPEEKVGLLMRIKASGRVEVVEYNVLDREIALARDPHTGRLLHEAGNINTNLVALEAIRADIAPTLYTGKVVDSRQGPVATSSLEMLNQHLTRYLAPERVMAYEVERKDFFMPTKNVIGVDSAESTFQMLAERSRRLLESSGAQIAPDAICDLSPVCGSEPEDLKAQGIGSAWQVEPEARLFLQAFSGREAWCDKGLHVGTGATLIARSVLPFGRAELDPERRFLLDEHGRSRIRIGKNVVLRPGIRVELTADAGSSIEVEDGMEFSSDTRIVARAGSRERIGK